MPSNTAGPPPNASGPRERNRTGGHSHTEPRLRPGAHPRPEIHPEIHPSYARYNDPRAVSQRVPRVETLPRASAAARPRAVSRPAARAAPERSKAEGRFRDALLPPGGRDAMPGFLAFLLAIPCAAVYAGSILLLGGPLNALTAQVPELPGEGIRMLLAPLPGALACAAALWRMFPAERRMGTAVHWQMLRWTLALLIPLQCLLWDERETRLLTLNFFLRFAAGPALTGGGVSLLLCYLHWRRGGRLHEPKSRS